MFSSTTLASTVQLWISIIAVRLALSVGFIIKCLSLLINWPLFSSIFTVHYYYGGGEEGEEGGWKWG